jgi:hypothetical protein
VGQSVRFDQPRQSGRVKGLIVELWGIDEVQRVPDLLRVIKVCVDTAMATATIVLYADS